MKPSIREKLREWLGYRDNFLCPKCHEEMWVYNQHLLCGNCDKEEILRRGLI